jgi:hypothetical protein
MRIFVLAAAVGAMLVPAAAADAQWRGNGYGYGRSNNAEAQCRRALRRADTRWEYRRAQRFCQQIRRDRRWHDDRRWRDDRDWRRH